MNVKKLHAELSDQGNNHEDRRLGVCFHGAASVLGIIIRTLEGKEEDPEMALAEFYSSGANNLILCKQMEHGISLLGK